MKRASAHILALGGGAAAWIWACHTSGESEAWDDAIYRQAALPALGALAALLGFWLRDRPSSLGLAASVGQMLGLAATRGEHAMWPVDVAILSGIAIPLGLSAWLGGTLRRVLARALGGAARVTRGCASLTRRCASLTCRCASLPRRLLAAERTARPRRATGFVSARRRNRSLDTKRTYQ
ncbi:MAG: hypothetical protein AB8H80_20700 [Planctomycetota bacterium]